MAKVRSNFLTLRASKDDSRVELGLLCFVSLAGLAEISSPSADPVVASSARVASAWSLRAFFHSKVSLHGYSGCNSADACVLVRLL